LSRDLRRQNRRPRGPLAALIASFLLAACDRDTEAPAPEPRPVRTVTVAKREIGETVAFTGRIEAENESRLAFRIGGRMIERFVNVGDRVEPDQVVAKLDPQDELTWYRAVHGRSRAFAPRARTGRATQRLSPEETSGARNCYWPPRAAPGRRQPQPARRAKHCFRPIMLTAISTVLGMMPIAPTIFWGPMSYAIMGGLLVATVLTLIFLPALYVAWFRVKETPGGVPAQTPRHMAAT